MTQPTLLVVDDDVGFVHAAAALAKTKEFEITIAGTVEQARARLTSTVFDIALIDLSLPDGNGLDLLEYIDLGETTQVIIITGTPTVESALKALHLPLLDYVLKPLQASHFLDLLDRAMRNRKPLGAKFGSQWHGIVSQSASMAELRKQVTLVGPTEASVLIQGESGVGKELIAVAINAESGRNGPFVAINCGAFPAELLTSQLFGHEKGSFTGANARHIGFFEQANGGTLFLDELTEMPAHLQVHLLRALETRTIRRVGGLEDFSVDVRIISATNRPHQEALREGRLREDLYYRLSEFHLVVPSLRDRPDDIIPIAEMLLQKLNLRHNTQRSLTATGMEVLQRYSWPGNVRELKNIIQRAYILADKDAITPVIPTLHLVSAGELPNTICFPIGTSLEEVEKKMLLKTLVYFDHNKAKTAEALGISTKTIHNKLAAYVAESSEVLGADAALRSKDVEA